MGRMTSVSARMCASLNQRSNLLLPTCHLHSLCVDAPEEGPEGPVRGEACSWGRPTRLFTASFLAFASSHGLSAEQSASQLGTGA